MIDPNAVSTIRVGELSPEPFSLTDNIPHEVGTELKRGTIEDLATFISAFIGSTDGVGFRAISVTDGQTLPTTTQQEFILVGKGTYYNVVGGSTIICTEELNAIVSNGSYWFVGVEIPVNVELAGITQFIRDGFINTTPSEDTVYEALALKANVADSENIANKSDIYTTDTEKYYSASYINGVLPTDYSKVVYMNANTPALSTIFDTNNPPVTNDDLLKNDTANLYIGTDASTWVYLTGTGYVTKTVTSATSNFNTFGTTIDAGNSKTSHIIRSGPVTLTGSLNLSVAKISTTPNTSAGSYDILTRNSSTTALEKKLVSDFVQTTTTQSITGRKNLTSDNTTTGGVTIVSSRTTNTAGTTDSAGLVILNTGTNAIFIETGSGDGIISKAVGSGSAIVAQTFSTGAGLTLRNQGGTGDLLSAELGKVTISSAGKLSTTEVATSGNNVTNKTYVDAKITQTITNGVTDKSPSEDAVFDSLALKVSGSGTTNYLPKFTRANSLGNSLIYDNGTGIGINTIPTTTLDIKTPSSGSVSIGGSNGSTISSFNSSGASSVSTITTGVDTPTLYANLIVNKGSNQTQLGIIPTGFTFKVTNIEIARLNNNGNLLVNTTTDDGIATNKLQVNGNVKATQFRISALNTAPASATDTGTLGEVRITATYIYVCTATNTWVRTALTTW